MVMLWVRTVDDTDDCAVKICVPEHSSYTTVLAAALEVVSIGTSHTTPRDPPELLWGPNLTASREHEVPIPADVLFNAAEHNQRTLVVSQRKRDGMLCSTSAGDPVRGATSSYDSVAVLDVDVVSDVTQSLHTDCASTISRMSTTVLPTRRSHARRSLIGVGSTATESVTYRSVEELSPIPTATERFVASTLDTLRTAGDTPVGSSWEIQFDALTTCRRLVFYHRDLVKAPHVLGALLLGVTSCLRSLRSVVAKNALLCVADVASVFANTRALDAHYDAFVPIVMRLGSDGVVLLQQSAHTTLQVLASKASCGPFCSAVLRAVRNSKNTSSSMKALAAQYVALALWADQRRNPGQRAPKPSHIAVIQKVLAVVGLWLQDGNQTCRGLARTLVAVVMHITVPHYNPHVVVSTKAVTETDPEDLPKFDETSLDIFLSWARGSSLVGCDDVKTITDGLTGVPTPGTAHARPILKASSFTNLKLSSAPGGPKTCAKTLHLSVPAEVTCSTALPPLRCPVQQICPLVPCANWHCIRPVPAPRSEGTRPVHADRRRVRIMETAASPPNHVGRTPAGEHFNSTAVCPTDVSTQRYVECAECAKKDDLLKHLFLENHSLRVTIESLKQALDTYITSPPL